MAARGYEFYLRVVKVSYLKTKIKCRPGYLLSLYISLEASYIALLGLEAL